LRVLLTILAQDDSGRVADQAALGPLIDASPIPGTFPSSDRRH